MIALHPSAENLLRRIVVAADGEPPPDMSGVLGDLLALVIEGLVEIDGTCAVPTEKGRAFALRTAA